MFMQRRSFFQNRMYKKKKKILKINQKMHSTGFEHATIGLKVRCSNHL